MCAVQAILRFGQTADYRRARQASSNAALSCQEARTPTRPASIAPLPRWASDGPQPLPGLSLVGPVPRLSLAGAAPSLHQPSLTSQRVNRRRRAGAPRLIEWTGERCVPWADDIQVIYEHLHRYAWAADLVRGQRVLDLASGEGFGAAMLADTAASVVGVDIDPTTVEHSRLNYEGEGLEFEVADALDLSRFEEGSFDVVVAFEMIEHVTDHSRLLAEIFRVLRDDGLLVMSTPDRRAYSEATGEVNPFHLHELDPEEFRATLSARFANVSSWGQRTITGSALAAIDASASAAPASTTFIERAGEDWREADAMSPLYVIALASNAPLPAPPRQSVLADCGLSLLREAEARAVELRRELELELARAASRAAAADDALRQQAASAQAEAEAAAGRERALQRDVATRDVHVDSVRRQLLDLRRQLSALRRERGGDEELIGYLEVELTKASAFVMSVNRSVVWRAFQRLRGEVFRLAGGEDSRRVRALQWTLRAIAGRRGPGAPREDVAAAAPPVAGATVAGPTIEFPVFEQPDVSIVIPAYSRADLTRRCLESILENTTRVAYEVIIVDDAADADTKHLLASVRGARIVTNEANLGYLRSVNTGAALAHGRWLVLANNDIEVYEEWLTALVIAGDRAPEIAIVTPKYLDADFHLSEAGGVIWSDGTGVNYGRGERTDSWRYEYRRDVDYGSAAALLVRRDFWVQRGGYDEAFAPMYYEDTDLCFDAREHGLRVVYEPEANVIHHEGATAGTDITAGHKRHQEQNRHTFVAKWRHRLEADYLPPGPVATRQAIERVPAPHVLVVDHRVPTPDRDSGSLRMFTMIESLREIGCRVTFLPDNREAFWPYTRDLQRLGVEVLYPPVDLGAEIAALGPNLSLVLLSRPHVASRWLDLVRELAPNARVAYDTVDLHWLREARRVALNGSTSPGIELKSAALRELELALIRATDTTLVVTEAEREQVRLDVPDADVRVLPNVHPLSARVAPFDARAGLLFVGGFEHTPNVDAVLTLVNDVMPLVWRENPELRLTVVGADAPPEIRALASANVRVPGWVPDLEPLLSSALALVAPLRYGAGLKGKVTQALAAGLPVVTTPIGAEGLDASDGEQLLIGADAEELAARTIRVVSDRELWGQLSRAGQALAAERCAPAVLHDRLTELLAGLPMVRIPAAARA